MGRSSGGGGRGKRGSSGGMPGSFSGAAERMNSAYDSGKTYEGKYDNLNAALRDPGSDLYKDVERMTNDERIAMDIAIQGGDRPYYVEGWRYGNIPSGGTSYNYRDQRFERGLSVMEISGGGRTVDRVSAAFIAASGRPVVRVGGFLNTINVGSDGEPLLLFARAIG